MNRKYLIVSIVLAAVIIISSMSIVYISNRTAVATPESLYFAGYAPVGRNSWGGALNVTQGSTQQINYTLTSMCPSQFTVPFENLTLTSYDSFYNNWNNVTDWNPSIPQDTIFNYTVSQSQLTLQPNTSNSTVITIRWAGNAPTGRYIISVNLGQAEFPSEPSKYDGASGFPVSIEVIVNPQRT
jgi:hypothetical protein